MRLRLRLHRHTRVSSTSELAFEELAAGRARHGDAFLAAEQTAGRGRLGRRWESPPGGVYLSVVWDPASPPAHPAVLTMAAGLGVLATVRDLGVDAARLDWPNDVVVGGAKLAGTLVESRSPAAGGPYVVGIGLNVTATSFPEELLRERPVTSLALLGREAGVERAAEALTPELERALTTASEDPRSVEREYLAATGLRGQRVRVLRGAERCEGFLEDITLAEGICLRRPDGWLAKVPVEHATAVERCSGE